jgi:hypothetical protein
MAERSASIAASAGLCGFVETGRTYYRLTYRRSAKEAMRARARLRFQLASLQCWGKWARSFT